MLVRRCYYFYKLFFGFARVYTKDANYEYVIRNHCGYIVQETGYVAVAVAVAVWMWL